MTPEAMSRLHLDAMRWGRPWSAGEFCDLCAAKGAIVAIEADAFCVGRIVLDEVELLTIAVAPQAQGRGKGRALLDRFHAAASDRGGAAILLEVAAENAPARALYAAAGYAQVGLRRAYYGPGDDALVLRRELHP